MAPSDESTQPLRQFRTLCARVHPSVRCIETSQRMVAKCIRDVIGNRWFSLAAELFDGISETMARLARVVALQHLENNIRPDVACGGQAFASVSVRHLIFLRVEGSRHGFERPELPRRIVSRRKPPLPSAYRLVGF